MIQDEILQRLKDMQDITYRGFQAKLVPTVDKENIIGVRIPDLRKLAKEFSKREDIDDFLTALPHKYYDENQLHALIICLTKDYSKCLEQFQAFLPYIDNCRRRVRCKISDQDSADQNGRILYPYDGGMVLRDRARQAVRRDRTVF